MEAAVKVKAVLQVKDCTVLSQYHLFFDIPKMIEAWIEYSGLLTSVSCDSDE